MFIRSIESFPVRLPRDLDSARGTAGSPTPLIGSGDYRWSTAYPVIYSIHIETALVKVTLDSGLVGWGEAQAPVAPEVACAVIDRILAPVLTGRARTIMQRQPWRTHSCVPGNALSTLAPRDSSRPPCIAMSGDAARKSACAT